MAGVIVTNPHDHKVVATLQAGGVSILRTDTLYGIVAKADDEAAVARVHAIKQRSPGKPLIVLIASPEQAYDGQAMIAAHTDSVQPTTIIVPSPSAPIWLQHSDGTVAYRVPCKENLRALLIKTGPLVAPSANREGEEPAQDVTAAKAYFEDLVDIYVDESKVIDAQASRIIRVETDGTISQIR